MLTTEEYKLVKEKLALLHNTSPREPDRAESIARLEAVVAEYEELQKQVPGVVVSDVPVEVINGDGSITMEGDQTGV